MSTPIIKKISAIEILESRGTPTILVTVEAAGGITASAAVPSGTSSGKHEAVELRDRDPARYNGKGVLRAIGNVEKIIFPKLKGRAVTAQQKIDKLMIVLDGTENKSRLGANAILGVSLAIARAGAEASGLPLYKYLRKSFRITDKIFLLPKPMFNLLNGGEHADSGMDIQEFLFIPHAAEFREAVRQAAEVFAQLRKLLTIRKLETGVGLEGGFGPKLRNSKEALELLTEAVRMSKVAGKYGFGLDVAAVHLYDSSKDKRYVFKREKASFSRDQLIAWYQELLGKYPLVSIEDGLDQDDWEGWIALTQKLGRKILIIGDDLTVTSSKRIAQAVDSKAVNAVIIKPNQIGTLTETMEAIFYAQRHGIKVVISHRSGDTPDDFIADLAVAVNADYIKAGAVSRGERTAKYNRLMEIESKLAS
ncbi:MAG: phosphopyruvate hydratase [Candidatus Doudnabacteria bacterium]|nr:phosphopyruvate hydratase [Candidatus Doudnabacteria bacterium]